MPQTLSEPDDDDPMFKNMVSNLPLLFAGGYPTSLERITELQLEKFIPFLVQCSLGFIQIQHNAEYSEPEWWPEDVPFAIPLRRPASISAANWHTTMKEIVVICYSFHKGIFLLRFCNELCSYQPEFLRFINNKNSTTSLYDRISNKLLVTFRNENMMYDMIQAPSAKKTLMPQRNSQTIGGENGSCQSVVEPALLDIYLCDHCEAELYTLEAYREHERNCKYDDDVIFCGTDDSAYLPHEDPQRVPETLLKQSLFLQMFDLKNDLVPLPSLTATNKTPTKRTPEKLKRWPKRGRQVMLLAKCPTIPISSPAGQRLVALSKISLSPAYLRERQDRTERFCLAPSLGRMSSQGRHKFMERKPPSNAIVSSSFRPPPDYFYHQYTFPRRQFSKRRRHEAFLHLNWGELRLCQPVSINIRKISLTNLKRPDDGRRQRFSVSNHELKTILPTKSKETDDSRRRSKAIVKRRHTNKIHPDDRSYSEIVAEAQSDYVIDLCSSDEEMNYSNHSNQQRKVKRPNIQVNTIHSPEAQVSIHPINPSASTDPCSSNSFIGSQHGGSLPSPNQPSVLIISHLTQTSMTLDNHKKTYRFQNQENNFQQFVNGTSLASGDAACGPLEIASLPNSITLTTANHQHTSSSRFLPEVVLERISNGVLQSSPSHQLCIDLT